MTERLHINEALVVELSGDERRVSCVHCGHLICADGDYRAALAFYEGDNTEAGPHMWRNPADYVDVPIVFRQYTCPSCFVALVSEVVPVDHPPIIDEIAGAGSGA